jgi:solute carrier family 45 protein 1/2/4
VITRAQEILPSSMDGAMDPESIRHTPRWERQKLSTPSIMAMTCGIGGYVTMIDSQAANTEYYRLQVLWSTIFSYGSFYLFSLGISKTQSSLIWAAAPICGSIVQPVVGVISDRSRTSWGRRRPFIVGGVVATVLAATALAWARPISAAFCTTFGPCENENEREDMTRVVAILSIVLLNASIQPLQLGLRSLSMDVCPREQQSMASAWASRFAGMGNIVGYILGSLPLPWYSSHHETDRFRFMVHCTIVLLITTSLITCHSTEEEDPRLSTYEPVSNQKIYQVFHDIVEGFARMPQRVRHVYLVQFFSWMGWFGFLFYGTSFTSQLYISERATDGIAINTTLKDHGMRIGAMANLLFAFVALATSVVLPILSKALVTSSPGVKSFDEKSQHPPSRLHIIWGFGQVVYVTSVVLMVVASSTSIGIVMITVAGLSWGITQWVPYAIIGEEAAMHQIDDESSRRGDERVWSVIQGGKIMGMHNAAISVPQIIAAVVSSVSFWIAQALGRENAVAWIIGWSGLPAAIAAWLAFKM